MARMIPDIDPQEMEHGSEAPVYTALKEQLDDSFTVLHSLPWLRPESRGGGLREGEADFVVLHPRLGMLVLEVKGGQRIWHENHSKWFRETSSGPRRIKDPFWQAQRSMHALLRVVEQRSSARISRDSLTHGYGVVFPHMDYEGEPPLHAPKEIIVSRRDLGRMDQAVRRVYRAWSGGRQGPAMEDELFSVLLHDCLMPRFHLFRPVNPELSGTVEELLRLTRVQARVFEGLYAQRRVLVEGVAGSGKTVLALNRALAFARDGGRTLFLCYNRELAAWIRGQVEADENNLSFRDRLCVRNFHDLGKVLADMAGIAFLPPDSPAVPQEFWEEEVPEIMEEAVLRLLDDPVPAQFDAIVMDEAQDFRERWWTTVLDYLLREPDGPLYVFMDPNQTLYGRFTGHPLFDLRFSLDINCRNTRKIALSGARILDIDAHVLDEAPEGRAPRLLSAGKNDSMAALVRGELKRLLRGQGVRPRQVVLIGPARKGKGSLRDLDTVLDVPLVTSVRDWRDGKGILVTTARTFKGLEADVVILYDLEDFLPHFTREDLYVAWTRARARLAAVARAGGACHEICVRAVRGL